MEKITKYPSTLHLEGSALQHGDKKVLIPYSAIQGKWITLEEKVDGAQSGVSFDKDATQYLQSRGHYLASGRGRERQFRNFMMWAQAKDAELYTYLSDRYIAYGEWVFAKHTVFYDHLPHYWLEFDIYDRHQRVFLSTTARRQLLQQTLMSWSGGLPNSESTIATNGTVFSAPVLFEGYAPRHLKDLLKYVRPSCLKTPEWRKTMEKSALYAGLDVAQVIEQTESSELMEGLYIKVEEGDKVVDRLKWVRDGFLQTIVDNEENEEDGDGHWSSRPILQNSLGLGRDIFLL